jgi:F-type H+-transporting ATPase subunit delta
MSEYRVSYRYAKSILDLAIEKKQLDSVFNDFTLFNDVIEENRDFLLMLRSPVIDPGKKNNILKALFGEQWSKMTSTFFDIVVRKGREYLLPDISQTFINLYNRHMEIDHATITTTFPLSDEMKDKFKAIIKQTTGSKQVIIEEIKDDSIIGGYILKVGDLQIDDSILGKLKEIERTFTQEGHSYEKAY